MMGRVKKMAKVTALSAVVLGGLFATADQVSAKELKTQPSSYETVIEVKDWGATVTKIIVDLGRPVPQGSVTTDTFSVNVSRSDSRLEPSLLGAGIVNVTNAYVADKDGNPAVQTGKYAVLEMEYGPTLALSSALNYQVATGRNDWTTNAYTITQQTAIETPAGSVSGLVVTEFAGTTKEIIEDFETGASTFEDVTLTYADYSPAQDNQENPLIIWLHGGGEGGTDATIPLAANKATALATDEIQSYFDGAYVLAPQTPTYWMDGIGGRADGSSKYEDALMALIEEYIANNPDVDTDRIYIGGPSNGGYMTMLMVRDYPGYFAAAFPVCEGLNDVLISDADIQNLAQTPIWFTAAANDMVLPPAINTIPTYNRLLAAGADVYMTLFDNVEDTSGLYTNADGTPYQYNGHFSWVYVHNNEVSTVIDGPEITLMQWLSEQSLND